MSGCHVLQSGRIELFFYGELAQADAAAVREHLRTCPACDQALDELRVIESALASRPVVAAPGGGDWTRFMSRLEDAIAHERRSAATVHRFVPRARMSAARYLALAALLTLVTASVVYVARSRDAAAPPVSTAATAPAEPAGSRTSPAAALAAVSEQHFERSKLVVLGLATKDPSEVAAADWAYERQLATSLLDDTRMYRRAAEQRGMTSIARVMGDLELVLLQASTADAPDPAALERLQRLIRKRDLVTKMEAVNVNTAGM